MPRFPNFSIGTEAYPPNVARRLRAVTITCWATALGSAIFGIWQLFEITPGLWKVIAINFFDAILWGLLPFLHRFSPKVAVLTFIVSFFVSNFVVMSLLGTGSGMQLHYLAATALIILFLGVEQIRLAALFGAIAALLVVAAQILIPANTGLVSANALLGYFIFGSFAACAVLFYVVYYALRQMARARAAAEREHQRSEKLLANILPGPVAARLKEGSNAIIADRYSEASVLFADMEGFTARASDTPPEELVEFLNRVFSEFDGLVARHGLEKIKTTGDAYMVVSGVPQPRPDHAAALADLALAMGAASSGLVDGKGRKVRVRIGMDRGPVVAGVVGTAKFFYDVWGDTVNTASRMESTADAGTIQVSPQMRELLVNDFELVERGMIDIRGKGPMRTWLLIGRKTLA